MGASGCGGAEKWIHRNHIIYRFILLDNSIKQFHVVCTISVSFSPCLDVHLLEVAGEGEGTKSDRGEEGDKGEEGEEGDEDNHIKGAACRVTCWKFVLAIAGFSLSLNFWHILIHNCHWLSTNNYFELDCFRFLEHVQYPATCGSGRRNRQRSLYHP